MIHHDRKSEYSLWQAQQETTEQDAHFENQECNKCHIILDRVPK